MPPISDKAQEAVQKSLAKYPDYWHHGICAFVFINRESGATSGSQTGDVCHASLNRMSADTCLLLNAHKPEYHGKYPDFVRWVCRESPFAKAVLNKDNDNEILTQGMVIDPFEIGGGGTLWLCKAARHTVENTFTIPMWERLMKAGLDPFQAFIGADILCSNGRPKYDQTHEGLFAYREPETIRKWYDEIRVGPKLGNGDAARPHGYEPFRGKDWGSVKDKKVKKPDGWGGYIEVSVPSNEKEYVEKLKEIFEGDPKNVK